MIIRIKYKKHMAAFIMAFIISFAFTSAAARSPKEAGGAADTAMGGAAGMSDGADAATGGAAGMSDGADAAMGGAADMSDGADAATGGAADKLYALGLFQGVWTNDDGSPIFDLEREPTRAEAATMLIRLIGKEADALNGLWTTPFTDVAPWAAPYVGYAYNHGLTFGVGETVFGCDQTMSAAQYLTLVLRALGYVSGKDYEWEKAWELTDKIGLTDSAANGAPEFFTRGDIAGISLKTLTANLKDSEKMLYETLVESGVFTENDAALAGIAPVPPDYDENSVSSVKHIFSIKSESTVKSYEASNSAPDTAFEIENQQAPPGAPFILPEPSASPSPTPSPAPSPAAAQINAYDFETGVFDLTNRERLRNGLPGLIWDDSLASAARKHSEDLAVNDFTGHVSSDGSDFVDRIKREGVIARSYCENICYGYFTPEDAIAGWMNSPGHKDNILNVNSTHIGVGFFRYPGSYYEIYVTVDFAGYIVTPQAYSHPVNGLPVHGQPVDGQPPMDGLSASDGLSAPDGPSPKRHESYPVYGPAIA